MTLGFEDLKHDYSLTYRLDSDLYKAHHLDNGIRIIFMKNYLSRFVLVHMDFYTDQIITYFTS